MIWENCHKWERGMPKTLMKGVEVPCEESSDALRVWVIDCSANTVERGS